MTLTNMRGTKALVWIVLVFLAVAAINSMNKRMRGVDSAAEAASREAEAKASRVQYECEDALKALLVSPATMRVAERMRPLQQANEQWRYAFEVDSQNGFGALIRSSWLCVHRDGTRPTLTQQ